ncbi:ATP-binding protein [Verrucomicrobiota bacterium]
MKETIDVGTGEVAAGSGEVVLLSSAIGSCVVIAAYDSVKRTGALAHVMLPGKSPKPADAGRTRYAADAIEAMRRKMVALGSGWDDIEVCVVGGGNILQRPGDTVCRDNIQSVLGLLTATGFRIVAKAVGGTEGRNVSFDIGRGTVLYTEGRRQEQVLWQWEHDLGAGRPAGPAQAESSAGAHQDGKAMGTGDGAPGQSEAGRAGDPDLMRDLERRTKELQEAQVASLNLMEDMEEKSRQLQDSQTASLNLMEDMEKQRAELSRAKAYIDNIFRSMVDSLIVTTPDDRISTVNSATCSLLGYTDNDLINKPMETVLGKGKLPPEDADDSFKRFDTSYLTKDHEEIPVSLSVSMVKDPDGKAAGLLYVARDMRESHLLRELEKSNRELKEATAQLIQAEKLSALGELAAGVAHELNQPLNVIKIICQSITRDLQKERYEEGTLRRDLPDILDQVGKMAQVIDHMRIFSRRAEGLPMEHVDLNILLEGAFKFLGQQLMDHGIQVVKNFAPDLPSVIGDPIRLEQVFMNLITNARTVLEDSGASDRTIVVRTYRVKNEDAIRTDIADNGPGVSKDITEKIFQPFFTTKEPGKGTGLGLSVASKIIEEHKGSIRLISTPGDGATFTVILPIAETA